MCRLFDVGVGGGVEAGTLSHTVLLQKQNKLQMDER